MNRTKKVGFILRRRFLACIELVILSLRVAIPHPILNTLIAHLKRVGSNHFSNIPSQVARMWKVLVFTFVSVTVGLQASASVPTSQVLKNQGDAFLRTGEYSKALDMYKEVMIIERRDDRKHDDLAMRTWFNMGLAHYNIRALHSAKNCWSKVIRHPPYPYLLARSYENRGKVRYEMRSISKALDDLNAAVAVPNHGFSPEELQRIG